MSEKTIVELDGYDLIERQSLDLGNSLQCVKQEGGTNTTKWYHIMRDNDQLGTLHLSYGLKTKIVTFDIAIAEANRGENLGMTTLQQLADILDSRGFQLVTGGIDPSTRSYWEHVAEKGLVTPIDPSDAQTQYLVSPLPALPNLSSPR